GAERDLDLRALLPPPQASPHGRGARPDPCQRQIAEDPGLPRETVRQAEPLQQVEREPQRQAHDAEEVAADPFHQRGPFPLDRVRARLVHRLPRRDVRGDLIGRERPERHLGDVEGVLEPPVARHGDRRHHLVRPTRELRQHRGRLRRRVRLLEHGTAQHHGRIGHEHRLPVLARRHDAGLLPCQARDVALGQLRARPRLVHVRGDDAKRQAEHLEQLAPPGRAARQNEAHFSSNSVTGPSFTSSTSIIAPNSPVSMTVPLPAPRSFRSATNRSYKGIATSGGAASMKLGRRPLLESPYRVNCDTTSNAPPTSASARFIFPWASPNTRSPRIFSAIQARLASPSDGANPARTRNPAPIFPVTLPATRTSARRTRWRTTLTPPSHSSPDCAADPRCSRGAPRCNTRAAGAAGP